MHLLNAVEVTVVENEMMTAICFTICVDLGIRLMPSCLNLYSQEEIKPVEVVCKLESWRDVNI